MLGIVTSPRDRLAAFLDVSAERIGEVGLVVVLAAAKVWNKYADRRETKRAGRRATDRERAAVLKSVARCEEISAELAKALARLTARVRALEKSVSQKGE